MMSSVGLAAHFCWKIFYFEAFTWIALKFFLIRSVSLDGLRCFCRVCRLSGAFRFCIKRLIFIVILNTLCLRSLWQVVPDVFLLENSKYFVSLDRYVKALVCMMFIIKTLATSVLTLARCACWAWCVPFFSCVCLWSLSSRISRQYSCVWGGVKGMRKFNLLIY